MERYFKPAGDLDIEYDNKKFNNKIDIQTYLLNVVSGIEYDVESDVGTICSEGNVIISFSELQEMVDSGEYNIINAIYFNEEMIEIKFQRFNKSMSRKL